MPAFVFPEGPSVPTPEEIRIMEQWLRDGTVPAEYVERVTSGRFSTAEPYKVELKT